MKTNIRIIERKMCKHCLGSGLILNVFPSLEDDKTSRFITCPKCKGHGDLP